MGITDRSKTIIEKEDVRKLYKNYSVMFLNERLYYNYFDIFKCIGIVDLCSSIHTI